MSFENLMSNEGMGDKEMFMFGAALIGAGLAGPSCWQLVTSTRDLLYKVFPGSDEQKPYTRIQQLDPVCKSANAKDSLTFDVHAGIDTKGLVGLRNIGLTCYMNSALQCLLQCPRFVDAFLESAASQMPKDSISRVWAHFVQRAYASMSNSRSIEPREVMRALQSVDPHIGADGSDDAFTVIAALLRGIDQELSPNSRSVITHKIREKSARELPSEDELSQKVESLWHAYALENDNIVRELFDGVAAVTQRCHDCGYSLMKFQKFRAISLPSVDKRITLNINVVCAANVLTSTRMLRLQQIPYDNTLVALRCLIFSALRERFVNKNIAREDVDLRFGSVSEDGHHQFYDEESFSDCSSIARNAELFVEVSMQSSSSDRLLPPSFTGKGSNTTPQVLRSVSECLAVFEAEEETGSCAMRCRECQKRPDVVAKRMAVLRTPQILTLHIDRDAITDADYGKSNRLVEYPIDEPLDFHGDAYDLFGVVAHHGNSTDGGHYIAKVKSLRDGQWYEMNDERVTRMRNVEAMKADHNATVLLFSKREGAN